MRLLIVVLLLMMPVQAMAEGLVLADYTARISAQDQVNSQGDRLTSPAAVLRQDRANFHRFDQADREDESDALFTTAEQRARFERLLSRGLTRPDVRRAIVNDTPLIRVTVTATRATVVLIEP